MTWFWMNIPLCAAFFAAWTAIPLWLVLRHPDTGREPRARSATGNWRIHGGADHRVALGSDSAIGHDTDAVVEPELLASALPETAGTPG